MYSTPPIAYSGLVGLVLFFSGLPAFHHKASRIDTRYVIAFASGVVTATSMFEMIPEADVSVNWPLLGIGFFAFYLLERVVMIHYCDEGECELKNVGWVTLFGMSADNFTDGIAITASFFTNPILGLFVAIAVIVHEIPQSLAITFVMKDEGYSTKTILGTLIVGAFLYPAGAALAGMFPANIFQQIVALVAGEFIFIGAGELLPEAHKKFNIKVIASVIIGALFVSTLQLIL
jgi:zinc transporter ZupT